MAIYDVDYRGNNFSYCRKNIYTNSYNQKLKIRCNNFDNDLTQLYDINIETYGLLSNQGAPAPMILPVGVIAQQYAAGNKFWGNALNPKLIDSHTNIYHYYHLLNEEAKPNIISSNQNHPQLEPIFEVITNNEEACPEFFVFEQWPVPFAAFDQLDHLFEDIQALEDEYSMIVSNLDNNITLELLSDIYSRMPNGKLKNKLMENSPLSDTVLTALLIEYPLSHGNFKLVMERNMPVSTEVEPYLYERLKTLPNGIANQLYPLQSVNPNYRTPAAVYLELNFLETERQLYLNKLIAVLCDTLNNRPQDAFDLLLNENNNEAKQIVASTYLFEGDLQNAGVKLAEIEPINKSVEDWLEYSNILLSLYNNNKTLYNMDSTQLAFIREQAYKCPVGLVSANAQSVLYLLFGEEVPECEIMTTRSSRMLVKPVDFVHPDTDAYMEDNFPDPFTDKTLVNYYLPNGEKGSVIITDIYGRQVKVILLETGEKTLTIDAEGLMPGVYNFGFYINNQPVEYRKMIITQ